MQESVLALKVKMNEKIESKTQKARKNCKSSQGSSFAEFHSQMKFKSSLEQKLIRRINISSNLFLFQSRKKERKTNFQSIYIRVATTQGRGETLIQLIVIRGKSKFVSPPCIDSSMCCFYCEEELNMLIFFDLKRKEEENSLVFQPLTSPKEC